MKTPKFTAKIALGKAHRTYRSRPSNGGEGGRYDASAARANALFDKGVDLRALSLQSDVATMMDSWRIDSPSDASARATLRMEEANDGSDLGASDIEAPVGPPLDVGVDDAAGDAGSYDEAGDERSDDELENVMEYAGDS